MTIEIIIDKERAQYIKDHKSTYYSAELFEVKDKISKDQQGVRIAFEPWMTYESMMLVMFHVGINFGIDKGIEVLRPSWKPTEFKSEDIINVAM